MKFVDVIFYFIKFICFNRTACNNGSAGIYNAEYGVGSTNVNTNYIGFTHGHIVC